MAIKGRQQPGQIAIALFVQDVIGAGSFYQGVLGAEVVHRGLLDDGSLVYVELRLGEAFFHVVKWHPHPEGRHLDKADHWALPAHVLHGTSVMVTVYVDDVEATIARATAAGGMASPHPVQDTFWGDRVGQFTDPFGYIWRLQTLKEEMTQEAADAQLAALRAVHRARRDEVRPT